MNYCVEQYFEQYINKKPAMRAGTSFDYNNANYNLLAWIIEYISGDTYEAFIHHNIFQPLHMINSHVDDSSKPIRHKSSNYVKDFDAYIKSPYHNEKFSIGAGAIVSNCSDLYKWYICLRDKKLLSQNAYARFFKQNLNHYCYGLEQHTMYGTTRFSHGGDHLGVATYIQHDFDEDLCIIILSNNEAIDQYKLGNAISDIMHQVAVDEPTPYKQYPLNENQLNSYCGIYLKDKIEIQLINGRLYFTRFADNLHIEIYPIAEGQFVRKHSDQSQPYHMVENEQGKMTFFGYSKD